MKDIIKQLQKKVEAETDFSFTAPEAKSGISVETEPDNVTQPSNDSPSPPYMITPITDETVCTMEDWVDDDYLHSINRKDVIAQLDEILLQLIMTREMACGKELTQDLRCLFGVDLSPGTVYPHLSDLADEGILDVTEMKSQKVYTIDDMSGTFDRIETAVDRQVIFSLVMKALLVDIKSRRSQSQRSEMNER